MAKSWRDRVARLERAAAGPGANPIWEHMQTRARAGGTRYGSPEFATQWLAGVAARQADLLAHPHRGLPREE